MEPPAEGREQPTVVMTGPERVGSCAEIVVNAELSYGGVGRVLQYEWTTPFGNGNESQYIVDKNTTFSYVNSSETGIIDFVAELVVTNWKGKSSSNFEITFYRC